MMIDWKGARYEKKKAHTHTQTHRCTRDNNKSAAFGTLWGAAVIFLLPPPSFRSSFYLPPLFPPAVWLWPHSGYKMRQQLVMDPHTFCSTVREHKHTLAQWFTYSHKRAHLHSYLPLPRQWNQRNQNEWFFFFLLHAHTGPSCMKSWAISSALRLSRTQPEQYIPLVVCSQSWICLMFKTQQQCIICRPGWDCAGV